MRLKDKVAIITGGASGIGFAACKRFCEEGAKVILADINEQDGKMREEELNSLGYEARFVQANIANRVDVIRLMETALAYYERIDILINNAGITDDATLKKMKVEQFERVLDVNLTGIFHCTQLASETMVKQDYGKIINTSSVSGVYGNFGQTNYAATKAAVIGMTKTWAKELGRNGINVNAVAPGFTLTEMVKKMPDKVIEKMESNIALEKLGDPSDIANAYLFLAS